MRALAMVLAMLPYLIFGQGLLRSYVIDPVDTTYFLKIWYVDWDSGLKKLADHPFKVSTTTYFLPGEYIVGYYVGDTLLHAERLHFSHSVTVLEKRVLSRRVSLYGTAFIRPKKKNSVEKYIDW